MADVTNLGTRQLWETFSGNPLSFYRNVADEMEERGLKEKPTLSRALEYASPSQDGEPAAFPRMLREAGIRTKSDPVAGYWASEATDFLKNKGTRALLTEFFNRKWREVQYMTPAQRAVLLSTAGDPGDWQRPYVDAQMARWDQQVAPAIPLSELVGMTTPISGQDYRSFYLTYNATQLRQFRVGESADIPIATIAGAERVIHLKKYGRGLRASYEELRRMRVDKMARFIQLMAVQSEVDKVAAAISVLVNGDGNTGTSPTTHDLTTLDSAATAGTLTLKGWLAFKMKFANPYVLTSALMQEAVALQLALLNTGSANIPLVQANLGSLGTALQPINQFADGVRYGWDSNAPSLKIVGFDRRFALEYVTEIGGEIAEMERFIENQTQVMTMTEVNGFAIMDGNATLLLDVNA